jgi:acetolactate synthase small subunit
MTVQPGVYPARPFPVACFSVVAGAEPGVMPRVLEVFSKRGIVPSRWYGIVQGSPRPELHIDVQIAGMETQLREQIAESLRQIVNVETVLTSAKNQALSA